MSLHPQILVQRIAPALSSAAVRVRTRLVVRSAREPFGLRRHEQGTLACLGSAR